jgi:hypothetical protein
MRGKATRQSNRTMNRRRQKDGIFSDIAHQIYIYEITKLFFVEVGTSFQLDVIKHFDIKGVGSSKGLSLYFKSASTPLLIKSIS